MTRQCVITKKKNLFGNNVSHSNRKTRKKFNSNLHYQKFWSPIKKKFIRILLSNNGLRTVNKMGIDRAINKFNLK